MEYAVDFSKYMDDNAGDFSDDAAENGLMSLEMSDDADEPQVCAICSWAQIRNYLYVFCVG